MISFVDYCIGFKTNFCRASKLSKHFPQNKKKKTDCYLPIRNNIDKAGVLFITWTQVDVISLYKPNFNCKK